MECTIKHMIKYVIPYVIKYMMEDKTKGTWDMLEQHRNGEALGIFSDQA